jgi:hypothetical protein
MDISSGSAAGTLASLLNWRSAAKAAVDTNFDNLVCGDLKVNNSGSRFCILKPDRIEVGMPSACSRFCGMPEMIAVDADTIVEPQPGEKGKHPFIINSGGKILKLTASEKLIMQEWVHAITCVIRDCNVSKEARLRNKTHIIPQSPQVAANYSENKYSEKKWLEDIEFVGYSPLSLLLLSKKNPFRLAVVKLMNSNSFQWFILICIIVNAVVIANQDFSIVDANGYPAPVGRSLLTNEEGVESGPNKAIEASEIVFIVIYLIEMLIKIISMGIIGGKKSYLRDPWNVLDALVVLSGLATMVQPGSNSLGVLRSFRVLRPLRSVAHMPAMRALVETLINSVPLVAPILTFLSSVFIVFAIITLEIWGGRYGMLHGRCRSTPFPLQLTVDQRANLTSNDSASISFLNDLPSALDCLGCNSSYLKELANDNACSAGDKWADFVEGGEAKQKAKDETTGVKPCYWPYAPATNLNMGHRMCRLGWENSVLANEGHGCGKAPDGQRYFCESNYGRRSGRALFDQPKIMKSDTFIAELNWGYTSYDNIQGALFTVLQVLMLEGWSTTMYHAQDGFSGWKAAMIFVIMVMVGSFFMLNMVLAAIKSCYEESHLQLLVDQTQRDARKLFHQLEEQMDGKKITAHDIQCLPEYRTASRLAINQAMAEANLAGDNDSSIGLDEFYKVVGTQHMVNAKKDHMILRKTMRKNELRLWFAEKHPCTTKGFPVLKRVVDSLPASATVYIMICLNTLILSLDHYPASDDHKDALDQANLIFTAVFVLEAILKIIAYSPFDYFMDQSDLFDFMLVFASLIELPFFVFNTRVKKGAIFLAMRAFRFCRLFRLLNSLPTLRSLVMTVTLLFESVSYFAVLLLIIMFIFSLIGMQLFAFRFKFDPATGYAVSSLEAALRGIESPRQNFDDFWQALNSVFQILTGEDYQAIMYDGLRAADRGSRLYQWATYLFFVTWLVFGNFVMLNLLLAILIDGFSTTRKQVELQQKRLGLHDSRTGQVKLYVYRNGELYPTWCDEDNGSPEDCMANIISHILNEIDPPPVGSNFDAYKILTNADGGKYKLFSYPDQDEIVRSYLHHGMGSFDGLRHGQTIILTGPDKDTRHDPVKQLPSWADVYNGEGAVRIGEVKGESQRRQHRDRHECHIIMGTKRMALSQLSVRKNDLVQDGFVVIEELPEITQRMLAPQNDPTLFIGKDSFVMCMPWMGPTSPIRLRLCQLVGSKRFEAIVFAAICVSCIVIALDNPLYDQTSTAVRVLKHLDLAMMFIFTLEMLVKLFAWGVVGARSYTANAWNLLDLSLVAVSWIGFAVSFSDDNTLPKLGAFKVFRSLRALRIASRSRGMRNVVKTLALSLPGVGHVLFLLCFFYFIFSVMLVSTYQGALYACQGEAYDSLSPTQQRYIQTGRVPYSTMQSMNLTHWGTHWQENGTNLPPCYRKFTTSRSSGCTGCSDDRDCIHGWVDNSGAGTSEILCKWMGADWSLVTPQNFDNFLSGMFALFEASTTEGWYQVMGAMQDSRGVGMQPYIKPRFHLGVFLFFMFFMLFGSFFMLNLFIGVVIDTFQELKDKSDNDSLFLTDEQIKWVRMQRMMLAITPKRLATREIAPFPRAWDIMCREWIGKRVIDNGIFCCIIANTVTMGVQHLGQSKVATDIIEGLEIFFTVVFLVEAVLKILAMGSVYFEDRWNQFDFFVVVNSVLGMAARLLMSSSSSLLSVLVILRFVRIGRVFRLMANFRMVRILFNTILFALPSLCNIISLLFLVYFIYAVLGIQLFAEVPLGEQLNEHANFRSFGSALLLVIRISTGEGWNGIMHEVDEAGSSTYAIIYFYSFTVLMSLVFVNLFIAVILDTFQGCTDTEDGKTEEDCSKLEGGMSAAQYEQFCKLWASQDPEMDWVINLEQLRIIVKSLDEPLGMKSVEAGPAPTNTQIDDFIAGIRIKVGTSCTPSHHHTHQGRYIMYIIPSSYASR